MSTCYVVVWSRRLTRLPIRIFGTPHPEQVRVDISDDIFLSGVGYHRQEIG
jgi:hypothetical protein